VEAEVTQAVEAVQVVEAIQWDIIPAVVVSEDPVAAVAEVTGEVVDLVILQAGDLDHPAHLDLVDITDPQDMDMVTVTVDQ